MNDQKWFYASNDQQVGPVEWSSLMAGLEAGLITNETLVWAAHLPEWTPLGRCIEAGPQSTALAIAPSSEASPNPDQTTTWTANPTSKAIQPSATSKRKRNLTLLAVVLAVPLLGIVSAIAVPAFLHQRDKARNQETTMDNPQPSSIENSSQNSIDKNQLEQKILKFAREVDAYTNEINMIQQASYSSANQPYLQRDIILRTNSLQNFKDSVQLYELNYGRQALLIFARANGLQNAI